MDSRIAALASSFAERMPGERAAIANALSAGDRDTLIDRAHKLAGIAGMFGRSDIGTAALELEQRLLASTDYVEETERLLDLLERR
nr:Hpt domain-containing protein [Tsuneonella aeria]